MSIDGIWTGEILGPYGWENSGVYILEGGRIIGGSSRHYSNGTYTVEDSRYSAEVKVHYYGPPRAIFGEQNEEFSIRVKGKVVGDTVEAVITRSDKPKSPVDYRMTKRMAIPEKQA